MNVIADGLMLMRTRRWNICYALILRNPFRRMISLHAHARGLFFVVDVREKKGRDGGNEKTLATSDFAKYKRSGHSDLATDTPPQICGCTYSSSRSLLVCILENRRYEETAHQSY